MPAEAHLIAANLGPCVDVAVDCTRLCCPPEPSANRHMRYNTRTQRCSSCKAPLDTTFGAASLLGPPSSVCSVERLQLEEWLDPPALQPAVETFLVAPRSRTNNGSGGGSIHANGGSGDSGDGGQRMLRVIVPPSDVRLVHLFFHAGGGGGGGAAAAASPAAAAA